MPKKGFPAAIERRIALRILPSRATQENAPTPGRTTASARMSASAVRAVITLPPDASSALRTLSRFPAP
jgi:hypothetical protein